MLAMTHNTQDDRPTAAETREALELAGMLRAIHPGLLATWIQWGEKLADRDPDAQADLDTATTAMERGQVPDWRDMRTVQARAFHELAAEVLGNSRKPRRPLAG